MARLVGRTGVTAGQDFVVTDNAQVGASPENEIRIIAQGVSRKHARIFRENNQFWLEDVGATNGTFLNGSRIQKEPLRHLDVVTLGRAVDLIFLQRDREEPIAARPDPVGSVRLRFNDGPEANTTIDVAKGELAFGRVEPCNVVLASRAIGKLHARIQRTGHQVVLQDLESVNGTFVNGKRIDAPVVLKDGDVINFAGVRSATVMIDGGVGTPSAVAAAEEVPQAMAMPAFDQEWKTRFMWSPDELAAIEAARKEADALAVFRASDVAKAPPKGVSPKPSPAVAAAKAAPPPGAVKPASAVKPKEAGAATKPEPKSEGGVRAAPPAGKATVEPKPEPKAEAPAVAAPDSVTPAVPVSRPSPPAPAPPSSVPASKVVPPGSPAAPPQPAKLDDAETTFVAPRPKRKIRGVRLVGSSSTAKLGIGAFTIGRAQTADVCVDDRQVSRAHATIAISETAVTLEDLQTVNGTILNGREVRAREPLQDGDVVLLGATEFRVELIVE
jgi:pSer/pThr/pTyr-binding forkhead associated (FHA) protein